MSISYRHLIFCLIVSLFSHLDSQYLNSYSNFLCYLSYLFYSPIASNGLSSFCLLFFLLTINLLWFLNVYFCSSTREISSISQLTVDLYGYLLTLFISSIYSPLHYFDFHFLSSFILILFSSTYFLGDYSFCRVFTAVFAAFFDILSVLFPVFGPYIHSLNIISFVFSVSLLLFILL